MKPILFAPSATNFTTNGVGRLAPISCTVTEERNSIFELEMTVKMGCEHFEDIKQSAVVVAKPSPGRNPQPFRIYYVSRPIGGKVKVKAEHISYQLNYIPVMPFSSVAGVQGALNAMKANAAESCPFTFETDITSSSSYAISAPESIRHYLGGVRGSILDVFGGEYEWDNYNVILHSARGQNRGVTLRYGKNITDLKQEENIANTLTGICPYWQSTESTEGGASGLVTLPEKVVHSANAANFPFQRTVAKDFSDKFDNIPTEAQLRAYAQAYVSASGIGIPSVSIDVSFVDLAQTEEYKDLFALQAIELCDTITVEFMELGVSTTEKITKTVYDVLSERYTKIGVGNVKTNLARTIEEQIDSMTYMPTTEQMQRDVDRATGVLNKGRSGYVIINRNVEGYANEILFLDQNSGGNMYSATNVLRINQAGIGFSSSGYQGPYHQSWNLLGQLTLGGVNNSYGDLMILDENAIPKIQVDKNGLKLWNITAIGYYYNGRFYADGSHTTLITPSDKACYYDLATRQVYIYSADNTSYSAVSGKQGLLAKMTSEGLGVYAGTIDFSWGDGKTGVYADGEKFQAGDWIVDRTYGRSILQSDEALGRTTGMSAETGDEDQLYLWAGYDDEDDYVFVVNGVDAYVMYNGQKYPIGASIANLNYAVAAYIRDIEEDDEDDGDKEGDGDYGQGEDYGGGYLQEGLVTVDPDDPDNPDLDPETYGDNP